MPCLHEQEQLHGLESVVITWTKMIRAAMRSEGSANLNPASRACDLVAFPGPLSECASLKQRANDLNSLIVQLSTQPTVTAIVTKLQDAHSPLVTAFAVLETELHEAAERANRTV